MLIFGGKDSKYGLEWNSEFEGLEWVWIVKYCCIVCSEIFLYLDFIEVDYKGYWLSNEGLVIYDSIMFYYVEDFLEVKSIVFILELVIWYINLFYLNFFFWLRIVIEWYKV